MTSNLPKLADAFEQQVGNISPTKELFENVSPHAESRILAQVAGKLLYKAEKAGDPQVADRLRRAGKYVLAASDLLKTV